MPRRYACKAQLYLRSDPHRDDPVWHHGGWVKDGDRTQWTEPGWHRPKLPGLREFDVTIGDFDGPYRVIRVRAYSITECLNRCRDDRGSLENLDGTYERVLEVHEKGQEVWNLVARLIP